MTLEEARALYRAAWNEFLLSGESRRKELNTVMNSLYHDCVTPQDKEKELNGGNWEEFQEWIKTLPGYVEYWEGEVAKYKALLSSFDDSKDE